MGYVRREIGAGFFRNLVPISPFEKALFTEHWIGFIWIFLIAYQFRLSDKG